MKRLVVILFVFFGVAGCVDPGTLSVDEGPFVITGDEVSRSGGWVGSDNTSQPTDGADPLPASDLLDPIDDVVADPDVVEPEEPSAVEAPIEPPGPTCLDIEMLCDDACIDPSSSDLHCGGCNSPCGNDTFCDGGECACMGGMDLCGGACVDSLTDNANCGRCGNACGGGALCIAGACQPSTEVAGVLQASNIARSTPQDCGVYGVLPAAPPLEGDDELHAAGQVHADDMAANNFFSHTGSDGSSFVDRIFRTDFSGQPMGENIAGGGGDPAGVVQRWIDSDGHCRNLMNPDARKLGVGFAQGGQYGTLWVQVFGR